MASDASGAHARILEIKFTADESQDNVRVDSVTFARGRANFDAGNGFTVPFSGGAFPAGVNDPTEIELGTVLPPPSVIRLNPTFQA